MRDAELQTDDKKEENNSEALREVLSFRFFKYAIYAWMFAKGGTCVSARFTRSGMLTVLLRLRLQTTECVALMGRVSFRR